MVSLVLPFALLIALLGSSSGAAVIETAGFNSSALAKAIQQAAAGDTVQLPAGTFELTEPIKPKSGIKICGAGQEKTTIVYTGTKPGVLVSISGCEDVELAQLTLDGQNKPLVRQGVQASASKRLWLHHVNIRNLEAKTWGPHAILFSGNNPTMEAGVTDSRITDCRIENIGLTAEFGCGIRMAWGSSRNQVIGNVIRNTGRGGVFGDHSTDLLIRGNEVTGSGGVGLGIEVWGQSDRAVIEDNHIDHWLSIGGSDFCAVRRNVVSDRSGVIKFIGIEGIGAHCVYTENTVDDGQFIGLSVSDKHRKDFAYWGGNRVTKCRQWGAQFQGETSGIASHYFYNCTFSDTVRGDPHARYPKDSGHGFRVNGDCQGFAFENCNFENNGGYGIQLGGRNVDAFAFLRCTISGNGLAAITKPHDAALEFTDCKVEHNQNDRLPESRAVPSSLPTAGFAAPPLVRSGQPADFRCTSHVKNRLWDFGDGIPETSTEPKRTFDRPGKYRVTLIVWNSAGLGARAEKTIEVVAGN